jgi:hypothetical protein
LASVLAIGLSILGVSIVRGNNADSHDAWTGLLVGIIATPLAPVAKDLTTVLSTFATALKGGGTTQKH